jgi:hypothetical protein
VWVLGGLAMAAFSGLGCAGGCEGIAPAEAEMVPTQTIEGGMQVRITPGGLEKLTAEIPGLVAAAVQDLQVPPENIFSSTWGGDLTLCPFGCPVHISLPQDGVSVQVTDADTLTIAVTLTAETSLHLRYTSSIFGDANCNFDLSTDPNEPLHAEADIGFFIRQVDGELRIEVQGMRNVSVAGLEFGVSSCGDGFIEDALNWVAEEGFGTLVDWLDAIIGSQIGEWIANELLLPWLQPYIDDLLPDPMGVEGVVDIGSLISEFSPGTEGKLEVRLTPGGYVNLLEQGISLGVITGLNSDIDPETRAHVPDALGVMEHSEGARCVPPFSTFDMEPFVTQGDMTHVVGRDTFGLEVADELDGTNDDSSLVYEAGPMAGETADVGIGVSQYFLNLAGFHAINSGAMCVSMGTEQMDMLTVGLVGILIESLADLVDPNRGDAPMQVVIRPQTPAEFFIGQGTEEDALVDLFLRDFRVDLYPYIDERYVRALTLALDMHIGLNLETQVNGDGQLVVVPTIVGMEEENVAVRVHNSELVAEDPEELEATLPQILGIMMPLLTSALGEGFPLPELGNGLSLSSLEFRPNVNNTMLLVLASITPSNPPLPPLPVETTADVLRVTVPEPAAIRRGLRTGNRRLLPTVTMKLGARANGVSGGDADFEWQYRVDGGLWHDYRTSSILDIQDPAFILQGWHTIEVRARRSDRPFTGDRTPVVRHVLIDSVPPQLTVVDGGRKLVLRGFDLVTGRSGLQYSVYLGDFEWSEYTYENTLSPVVATALAAATGGRLGIRVKDEAGNVAESWTPPELWVVEAETATGGQRRSTGCSAAGTDGAGAYGWPLIAFLLLVLWSVARRFRAQAMRSVLIGGLVVGVSALGWIACGDKSRGSDNNNDMYCEEDADCAHLVCQDGQVPACNFGQCECVDDILFGNVGSHSSLVVASGPQAFVAGYNRTYGDLVVARFSPPGVVPNRPYASGGDGWEFVDGVPAGPVRVENSDIRGGIKAKGDDVGTYTDIDVNSDRQPVVAYHDDTHGSLKLAWYDGTAWQIHVVDDGGSEEPEEGRAGLYNAMVMRQGDRAPGIAYMVPLVETGDASEPYTCQLRFAQADSANPTSPNDWTIYIIDEVVIAPPADDDPPADWLFGTGVTPSVTLKTDGKPVVAYYDSASGNLMMSELIEDGEGLRYFVEPVLVAGEDDNGNDTGDMGVFPSIAVDLNTPNVYHFAFADANLEQLYYYNSTMDAPEVVDDGYRTEENELTGLPMPVYHYVGWDAQLLISGGGYVMILYQDGTAHELRVAERLQTDAEWTFQTIAGGEDPFAGAYGFYIDMSIDGATAYISSYVINEHAEPDLLGNDPVKYFVEIFERTLGPQ